MQARAQFHNWLIENVGQDLFTSQIVEAAERFFRRPYSVQIQAAEAPEIDGETYSAPRDRKRLTSQQEAIAKAMSDGAWHTLHELVEKCGGTTASISARIRDLRKEKNGGYTVETNASGGTWSYRIAL